MIAYAPRHYPAVMLFQTSCFLHDVASALRMLAQRLDVRIAAWKKAADDRRLLNQMSERELRDIVSTAPNRACLVAAVTDGREGIVNAPRLTRLSEPTQNVYEQATRVGRPEVCRTCTASFTGSVRPVRNAVARARRARRADSRPFVCSLFVWLVPRGQGRHFRPRGEKVPHRRRIGARLELFAKGPVAEHRRGRGEQLQVSLVGLLAERSSPRKAKPACHRVRRTECQIWFARTRRRPRRTETCARVGSRSP